MEWFARHTNWLYKETQALSNNSIYREQHQVIGKTLLSSGNIIVHKTTTEYFPVLIVYPEATPYSPPTIYILNDEINKETAIKYSDLLPQDIRLQVRSNIRFFNRRHQGEDGSVCFVETGDLHGESPEIFSIGGIIKRLRIWLSGKIPKDSNEVELFYHFANRAFDMEFLLPDLFFDETYVQGRFYAGLAGLIPANNLPDGIAKKTYMGVMIDGTNASGIAIPAMSYRNKQLILFTHIPDVKTLTLEENNEGKRKCIENGEVIEGYWWEISTEPEPFSSIEKLAQYVGNGNETIGFEKLLDFLNSPLIEVDDVIYIGLRFPGRIRKADWQIFRLKRGDRTPIILGGNREELQKRLRNYSVQALYQEYFTDQYFHIRNKGRAERNQLKEKAISMVGCGALGSECADALNKAGVGEILLVDKENMRAHNAVRHILGIDRTGIPKAFAMTENLIYHNPFVKVDFNISDILFAKIDEYIPESHIGISTIADDNIEAYLNQQAIEREKIIFYCRALRGGKVARIFRVIPHVDACKACMGLYLKENSEAFLNIPEDKTLATITNECNNPVRPASAADMKIVAGIFSRIIIDYLQGRDVDNNHWIWTSESLEGMNFGSSMTGLVRQSKILPHPNCPVCHRMEDTKVEILSNVLDFIKIESTASGDIETGGVLIGHRKSDGQYTILRASKPGPDSIRTCIRFEKDEEYSQKELVKAYNELGEKGLYIGEWHYHPIGSNEPSGVDINSLTKIADQENYRIDKPIMLIFSPEFEYALTIHDKSGRCSQIPFQVVSDQ